MGKDWIQSYSDLKVTPRAIRPEQVRFADIAHALAGKGRFTCQSKGRPYSVAQHCVLGARLLPAPFKLPFLLHELDEVYLPDINAPTKPYVYVKLPDDSMVPWTVLAAQHVDAMLEALGLSSIRPLLDSPQVKAMDLAMLAAEKEQIMGPPPEPWNLTVPAAPVCIYLWTPEQAEAEFTKLFDELTDGWGYDANGSPVP